MTPRDSSSTRFHPYDTSKKPKIHRITAHNSHPKKNHDTLPSRPAQSGLSINELKRRIRDVKRLLSRHADLSPEARIVQERALAGYEKDLKGEQERRQRSEMIKKYHFVRFLDRKTATKELRTAQRRLEKARDQEEQSSSKLAKLQAEVDIAQINVNYAIYYPLTEKYISLYPQDKKNNLRRDRHSDDDGDGHDTNDNINSEDTEESTAEKPPFSSTDRNTTTDSKPHMWHIVKKCMRENTLDQLRDGKLTIRSSIATMSGDKSEAVATSQRDSRDKKRNTASSSSMSSSSRQKEQIQIQDGEEHDSDGGFFEG